MLARVLLRDLTGVSIVCDEPPGGGTLTVRYFSSSLSFCGCVSIGCEVCWIVEAIGKPALSINWAA
jgi:hypothetical protein